MKAHTLHIITEFTYPPIPKRDWDWAAYLDGYEPGDPVGHGASEAEAIADLKAQIDESDEEARWYDELNRGYARDRI